MEFSVEQETALFKAICRYKPVGLDKHFLMVCISQMVNNSNVQGQYLSTKSIWEKLETLYNLEGLDELEEGADSSSQSRGDIPSSPPTMVTRRGSNLANKKEDSDQEEEFVDAFAEPMEMETEFSLPWDEYGEILLEHARNTDSQATSPAQLSTTAGTAGTPVSTPVPRGTKRGRETSLDEDMEGAESGSDQEPKVEDSEMEEIETLPEIQKQEEPESEEQQKASESEAPEPEMEGEEEEEEEEEEEVVTSRSTRLRGRTTTTAKTAAEKAPVERPAGRGRRGRTRTTKSASLSRTTRRHELEPDSDHEEEGGENDEDEDDNELGEAHEAESSESSEKEAEVEETVGRTPTPRGRVNRRGGRGTDSKSRGPRRSSRQTKK